MAALTVCRKRMLVKTNLRSRSLPGHARRLSWPAPAPTQSHASLMARAPGIRRRPTFINRLFTVWREQLAVDWAVGDGKVQPSNPPDWKPPW